MARVNAQGWLDKWGRRLNASQQDIQAGVSRVTTAPGQLAAAASARMLAGITEAVTNGTWSRQVAGVSLQSWQDSMKNKAIPRIAAGVASAQANKVGRINALLSAVDNAAAAANALPKGGLEESINRATMFMRTMSANAPRKTGATS